MPRAARLRPYEAVYHKLLLNAKRRKIACRLTYEDFIGFTRHTSCHYCGEPIRWIKGTLAKAKYYRTNLDRVNNSIGYQRDNLVVACKRCNTSKGHKLSYDQMLVLGPVLRELKLTIQLVQTNT